MADAYQNIPSLNSLCLIVIGDTGSGKSTVIDHIIEKLDSSVIQSTTKTSLLKYTQASILDNHAVLRISEMGGHTIYRIVLSLFSSNDSLVLLALDISQSMESVYHSLHSWLQSPIIHPRIKKFIICVTHGDCITEEELQERIHSLQDKISIYAAEQESLFEKQLHSPHQGEDESLHNTFKLERDFIASLKDICIIDTSFNPTSHDNFEVLQEIILHAINNSFPDDLKEMATLLMIRICNVGYISMKDTEDIFQRKTYYWTTWKKYRKQILEMAQNSGIGIYLFNSQTKSWILISPSFLGKILSCVIHHQINDQIRYREDYLSIVGSEEEFEKQKTAYLKKGVLHLNLLQCLWKRHCIPPKIEEDILSGLIQKYIWYKSSDFTVRTDGSFQSSSMQVLKVPYISTFDESSSYHQSRWPLRLPEGQVELQFKCQFVENKPLPTMFFERCQAICMCNLMPYHMSMRWRYGMMVSIRKINILLRHGTDNVQLKIRSSPDELCEVWTLVQNFLADMQQVLEEIRHVASDLHMICPHCILIGRRIPCTFSLSLTNRPCSTTDVRLYFDHVMDIGIPAALICPIRFSVSHDSSAIFIEDVKKYLTEVRRFKTQCDADPANSEEFAPSGTFQQQGATMPRENRMNQSLDRSISEEPRCSSTGTHPQLFHRNSAPPDVHPGHGDMVKRCTQEFYRQHERESYAMTSKPKGKVIIINNNKDRAGTDYDRDALKQLFIDLGFDQPLVYNHQDGLTARGMKEKLRNFASLKDHRRLNSCVVILLSHGEDGKIFGTDGNSLLEMDILEMFNNQNCQALISKPKIFIIQACRGGRSDDGVQADAPSPPPRLPAQSDMIIAHATHPGYVALRHPQQGTWFINSLVRVFSEHAHNSGITNMLHKVNNAMFERSNHRSGAQMPIYSSDLRKELFFFPGIYRQ